MLKDMKKGGDGGGWVNVKLHLWPIFCSPAIIEKGLKRVVGHNTSGFVVNEARQALTDISIATCAAQLTFIYTQRGTRQICNIIYLCYTLKFVTTGFLRNGILMK